MLKTSAAPSELARVKRFPERAVYDAKEIYQLIDSSLLSHVAYVFDGKPVVTPTLHWRQGNHIYWHGSSASRMLRTLSGGIEASVAITHFDGVVFARSGFSHSANYRSVMVFGTAEEVTDPEVKMQSLEAFVEHLAPGRWPQIRPPTAQELKATKVLRMDLSNASAKCRSGGPNDDAEDMDIPVWAGVVPLSVVGGAPETDMRGTDQVVPDNLSALARFFEFNADGDATT